MPKKWSGGTAKILFNSTNTRAFNFLYGTCATLLNVASTDAQDTVIIFTNGIASTPRFELYITNTGKFFGWTDGTTFTTSSIAVPMAETCFLAATKDTGTVAPRFHMYRPSTGVWTHVAGGTTNVDSAATTSFQIADGATFGLLADVWQLGMWSQRAMTDSEIERLMQVPQLDWRRFDAEVMIRFDNTYESALDLVRTHGRRDVRQTTRTGTTTKSVLTFPGGHGTLAVSRRK